jgi:phosphatidate cytidylyltransferase
MLWQRVLTAALLMPVVVLGVLYLDNAQVALVTAGVVLLGAAEMARLANLRSEGMRLAFVAGVALCLWLAWRFLVPQFVQPLQWLTAAWWIAITAMLLTRRTALGQISQRRPLVLVLGGALLVAAWMSLVALHAARPHGPVLLLFLLVLIWVADSGAYFAGRAFGRRKLAPLVSPAKTWAGVYGATGGALVSAVALSLSGFAGDASPAALVALSIIVTAVSIGGDLWESRLKREAGLKDSGSLLPGHGGMLDRIDSLVAAAPVFGLGAALIGVTA